MGGPPLDFRGPKPKDSPESEWTLSNVLQFVLVVLAFIAYELIFGDLGFGPRIW